MVFNSFTFFAFFSIVFFVYIFLNHKLQNRFLLISSYVFYGAWDFRFIGLIVITTLVDYTTALLMSYNTDERLRRRYLVISISINLCILGFFKYFNFFTESLVLFLNSLGFHMSPLSLHIILPVGISFYTFQSMSYTIDAYHRKIEPVTNILDYGLYVAFFPQLVAGPIERAMHLLPQILSPRSVSFSKIQRGCYYIGFGLFLKIFMADNLARLVDPVFAGNTAHTGFCYLLAGYGFTFQIYGDFAGYTYMAKGLGAILGFDIMNNFNLPYFAKNPQQFWRRWHISLSTWLRDYLYIPLGGNRGGTLKTVRNLFVTMLLGGLWHGAKMTFVIWGFFHGILLVIYHLFAIVERKYAPHRIENANAVVNFIKIFIFFHVVVISWYFFRANSLGQVWTISNAFFTDFGFDYAKNRFFIEKLIFYISPLLLFQIVQYNSRDLLIIFRMPIFVRSLLYAIAFYLVVIFGATNGQEFIYFQF